MTNPAYERDERHKIDFLKRNAGKIVWMGIRSDDKEVHGHRWWLLGRLDVTQGGTDYVWIKRDKHQEWKRIALDQIVRAAKEEPAPEHQDFKREWDEGLSQRPGIDALLAEASRHQLDGDAGTR